MTPPGRCQHRLSYSNREIFHVIYEPLGRPHMILVLMSSLIFRQLRFENFQKLWNTPAKTLAEMFFNENGVQTSGWTRERRLQTFFF